MASPSEVTPHAGNFVGSDEYIAFQLGKTQSNIKWAEIGAALLWISIAFFAYLLFFVVFDQWVIPGGFSLAPRLVMLALLVGGIGWAVCRHVLFPSVKQVHELYAARVLENADPALKSALLNYVDLQRAGQTLSPAVQRALEKRAAVTLHKSDVDQAVDRRPLLRFAYVLLALVALFGIYTVLSPKDVMTSVKRALLPSTTPVATQTQIAEVTPGHVTMAARNPLVVEADIRGKIPESVQLIYTTADRNILNEAVEMRQIDPALPRFRGTISSDGGRGLMQDVTYHVVAGDTRTEEYHATVIQPPSAKVNEVEYAYLPYTKLEPRKIPGGAIDAWEGSTVTVRATTNVPVKSAVLILTDKEDSHAKGDEIPLAVKEGTKLEGQWTLGFRRDGTAPRFYHIQVRTEKGETDPDPTHYPVKLRPDQPPEVVLLTPSGDVQMPANGTLAMSLQAADPDFGLRSLTLRADLPDGREPLSQRLFEDRELGMSFKGLHLFPLQRLKLKSGDKLQVWIEAKDTRQPTANARTTPKIEITLTDPVSPKQAAEELAKQQQKQDELASADMPKENPETPDQPENEPKEPKSDDPMQDDQAPRKPPEAGEKPGPKNTENPPEEEQPENKDPRSDEDVLKELLEDQQKKRDQQKDENNPRPDPNQPQPPQEKPQRDPNPQGENKPQSGKPQSQPGKSEAGNAGGAENPQNGGSKSTGKGNQGAPTKTPQNSKPGERQQPGANNQPGGEGEPKEQPSADKPSENSADGQPSSAGKSNPQKSETKKSENGRPDAQPGAGKQESDPSGAKPNPATKSEKEPGSKPEQRSDGMNPPEGASGNAAEKTPMPNSATGTEKKDRGKEKDAEKAAETSTEKAATKPSGTPDNTAAAKGGAEKANSGEAAKSDSPMGMPPEPAAKPGKTPDSKASSSQKPTESPKGAAENQPGGTEKTPGSKPGETPKPGDTPMPGDSPMSGEKPGDPATAAKPDAAKPGENTTEKKGTETTGAEKGGEKKTGEEKTGEKKNGAGKPNAQNAPKPGNAPMNTGDKPAGTSDNKTPGKTAEKPMGEKPKGNSPMPMENATGEKTAGEKAAGEKTAGENAKPGDMPDETKADQPGKAGEEKGTPEMPPKPQAGGQPEDMAGGKNEAGGGQKETDDPASPEQKPGGGDKGKPTAGNKPGANDEPAQPGQGTKPARQDDQAAAPGETNGMGEEKPTEDSENARDVKATGDEKGPATGSEKAGTNNARAKNDLPRKDDKQGVRKPGDPAHPPEDGKTEEGQAEGEKAKNGKKPENAKPAPGQSGGASDQAEQAKPANDRKTDPDRSNDPDAERPHDDAKNPDRPPERNGGQPDAGNDKLKGEGRKGGQKSESPMGGEAGGSKAAEKGNQGGQNKGPGDKSNEPGTADKANGKTGEAGTEKGNGSTDKPGDSGSKPSTEKGGSQESENGGKPEGASGEKGGQPNSKPGQPGGNSAKPQDNGTRQEGNQTDQGSPSNDKGGSQSGKGQGGDGAPARGSDPGNENMSRSLNNGGRVDGPNKDAVNEDSPLPPEENLQRNRDASNLVLSKLKDQLERGEVDQDLLKRLGWTEDRLENFVERMDQKINDPGEDNSPEGIARRKRFEEFLRSLELTASTKRKKAGDRVNRLGPNLQNDSQVPAEFREQYEAYTKSLSKEKAAPKK